MTKGKGKRGRQPPSGAVTNLPKLPVLSASVMPTGRDLLFEILSWQRPYNSITEKRFNEVYIDTVPGMQTDAAGNRYLRIGDAPVLWSCHTDTVASNPGQQDVIWNPSTGIIRLKGTGWRGGQCLGADDGAGVWLLLEMIRAGRPGLYVFHRGEERGCIGSGWIADHKPDFLAGIKAAVAFDRKGRRDIITYQGGTRTCSEAFAASLASQLNATEAKLQYRGDDTGSYTDTNEYRKIVPECSNVSVGYENAHGSSEMLDLYHLEKLRDAMLVLDASKLVIERDPSKVELKPARTTYSGGNYYKKPDITKRYDGYGDRAIPSLLEHAPRLTEADVLQEMQPAPYNNSYVRKYPYVEEVLTALCRKYPEVAAKLLWRNLTAQREVDAFLQQIVDMGLGPPPKVEKPEGDGAAEVDGVGVEEEPEWEVDAAAFAAGKTAALDGYKKSANPFAAATDSEGEEASEAALVSWVSWDLGWEAGSEEWLNDMLAEQNK